MDLRERERERERRRRRRREEKEETKQCLTGRTQMGKDLSRQDSSLRIGEDSARKEPKYPPIENHAIIGMSLWRRRKT